MCIPGAEMAGERDNLRRLRRIKTNMRGWVRGGGPEFLVQIADISINGCRIVSRQMRPLGPTVTITILDADLVAECEVAWQDRFSAGLRFVQRSTQADFGEDAMRSALAANPDAEANAARGRKRRV